MSEVLVGRQPIFDRKLSVHGYELLFRGGVIDPDDPKSGDRATSQVIVNAFTEIGADTLITDKLAFLNLTRAFIVGDHALPVSPQQVVLEVLETVPNDTEVRAGLLRLKNEGFTIALDDFVFRPEFIEFVELADLIKLDVLDESEEDTRSRFEELRPYKIKMLAEKIETREQYEWCRDIGFDYFQGFFLERPYDVRGRSVPPTSLTLLTLLHELHSPDFNFKRAEAIAKRDVGLCYRLLRHINSALYGMPRKISSIRETLVYLGIENVRNLTSLFMLATNDKAPGELINGAMVRARMCENLARASGEDAHHEFFIVGLFSLLGVLMQVNIEDVVDKLPLHDLQKAALIEGKGDMGQALRCVSAYERGEWDDIAFLSLTPSEVKDAYVEALKWSRIVAEDAAADAA